MIIYRHIHRPEYNAMEKARTQITHTPLHPVGAGFFVPVGLVLSELGTHLKGILSPLSLSKYPFWHWKLHSVLSSTSLVFGSLTAWIVTSAVDCSFSLSVLQRPASILRLLIVCVVTVHVCAAENGQKIVRSD